MLSSNDVLPSQMIEKLLQGAWVAILQWKLVVLEKCREQLVIKLCDSQVELSHPLATIRKHPQFLPHCAIRVALPFQGCCKSLELVTKRVGEMFRWC
jgi:hypothetical protein